MYNKVPPYHFMTAISAFIGAHTILNKENKCLFRESKQAMMIQRAEMHFFLGKYLEIRFSKPEQYYNRITVIE